MSSALAVEILYCAFVLASRELITKSVDPIVAFELAPDSCRELSRVVTSTPLKRIMNRTNIGTIRNCTQERKNKFITWDTVRGFSVSRSKIDFATA